MRRPDALDGVPPVSRISARSGRKTERDPRMRTRLLLLATTLALATLALAALAMTAGCDGSGGAAAGDCPRSCQHLNTLCGLSAMGFADMADCVASCEDFYESRDGWTCTGVQAAVACERAATTCQALQACPGIECSGSSVAGPCYQCCQCEWSGCGVASGTMSIAGEPPDFEPPECQPPCEEVCAAGPGPFSSGCTLVSAVGSTACSGDGGGGGGATDTVSGDTRGPGVDAGPTSPADAGAHGTDAGGHGRDTGPEDVAIPPDAGGFGAPCRSGADCSSGFCVAGPTGLVCTKTCVDECPEGWECSPLATSGPDITFVCLPLRCIDGQCGAPPCEPCEEPALPAEGSYLALIKTSLAPGSPIRFHLRVEHTGPTAISFEIQPLRVLWPSSEDPCDHLIGCLVGSSVRRPNVAVASDGTFEVDLGSFDVPGVANPISGSDIVLDAALQGKVRSASHVCGTVTGQVSSPIAADLAGTTFTAHLVPDPAALPGATWDCR